MEGWVCGGRQEWVGLGVPSPSYNLSSLPQDPDLEAKRKAELAKIKQQNRRFKEKVGQTLRRQKAESTGRRSHPSGPRPQEPAQAKAQD